MTELILKDEVYRIVGAALDVYYQLGRGFLEPLYQEAFELELAMRGVPFEAQKQVVIYYKNQPLEKKYLSDLICFGQIIVELKSCQALTNNDEAQLLNYMRAGRVRVGLLFNFSSPVRLEWKRYVM